MRDLVPIKIIIGLLTDSESLRANQTLGHASYPDFNSLPVVQASGLDWAHYINTFGLGWQYDSCCGHKEDTVDSPFGQQFGILIIPKVFADQAITAFGITVATPHAPFSYAIRKQTEPQLKEFYDTHVAADQPEQNIDNEILTSIKLHRDLGRVDEPWMLRALDPNTDDPGITKNKQKHWDDFKLLKGVRIVQ